MFLKPSRKTLRLIPASCLFLSLLLGHAFNLHAQTPPTADLRELAPGQTLEREMTGAETHRYQFALQANEFFQVRVEQKGVDVALKLLNADGQTRATMDSPNSKEGPETLSFVAEQAGDFILEVGGFEVGAEKGIYTIQRQVSRPATANDKRRVVIEKLFVAEIAAIGKITTIEQMESSLTKLIEVSTGWRDLNDNYLAELTAKLINQLKKTKADVLANEAFAL